VLTAGPTVGTLWLALRRRWLFALLVVLGGSAVTALLLCWIVPGQYVGELRVLFNKPPDYMPGSGDTTLDDYVRTQAQLLRSPLILNATLARGDVRNLKMVQRHGESATWLAKELVIKPAAGENVLPLKLGGEDAGEVIALLNALFEEYQKVVREERQAQLNRLKNIVSLDEADLRELARRLPLFDTPQIEQVRSNLIRSMVDLRRLDSEIKASRSTSVTVDRRLLLEGVEEALSRSAEATRLQTDMAALRKQMSEIEQFSAQSGDDPRLNPLRARQRQLQGEIDLLRQSVQARVEGRLLEQAEQNQRNLQLSLEERKSRLQDEVEILKAELDRMLGAQNPEQRSDAARRKVVESIRDRSVDMITRIERHKDDLPWVEKLGQPVAPSEKDRSNQFKVAGAGTFAVLGVLLFTVGLVEFRSRRAHSSDEITRGLGIPTVGTLPQLPANVRRAALSSTTPRELHWEGQLTEAVDALRTFLLQALGEGPHVVLVTSAVAGEGKTSLASQLAASLARAWRKTLLIDGDLRKPAAHKLFELPSEMGFSEVLRGEVEPADAIRPTAVSRLWLMPAGEWDPHAQQALAQDGVGNVFALLKEEYDLIIVDSCPVLPVTDTLLLGQHVDTVLLSVIKDTSRLPTVYAARQRLAALDIPVLGAVFVGGNSALGGLDIQYPH
jgi:capsular exopolysaccharide synthesis family protein